MNKKIRNGVIVANPTIFEMGKPTEYAKKIINRKKIKGIEDFKNGRRK